MTKTTSLPGTLFAAVAVSVDAEIVVNEALLLQEIDGTKVATEKTQNAEVELEAKEHETVHAVSVSAGGEERRLGHCDETSRRDFLYIK